MNKLKTLASPLPPRYVLRKGLGFWELTFEGRHAVFKHEQGVFYVAYLLLSPPPEPIHGLVLALKTRALYRQQSGGPEIVEATDGESLPLGSDTFIEQRS